MGWPACFPACKLKAWQVAALCPATCPSGACNLKRGFQRRHACPAPRFCLPVAADGSQSTGALVADEVFLGPSSGGGSEGGVRVPLTFGVEERQYGRLYSLGADGLLALDRAERSFVGQVCVWGGGGVGGWGGC